MLLRSTCSAIFFLFFLAPLRSQHTTTRFEQSNGTQTPDYFEIIDWWKKLDAKSDKIKMFSTSMTDAGFLLNLVLVANKNNYDLLFPQKIGKQNKRVILFNNGIHPGEPDGIDASMLLVRDIVEGVYKIPDNVVLAFIPVYNIGGCLSRSTNLRVDQNGPEAFGSRGNSQNLDLNRDFIKCDSKDARAFTQIFHLLDPDVFVDNHVSNGADYQHVMTLLSTQHNKLAQPMGNYLETSFVPALYALMKQKGFDLVPYVNHFGETPDKGWPQFWDSPRYGSGYGALWNTFSFVPETHMLKAYDLRVRATYALMQSFIEFTSTNSDQIKAMREQAKEATKNAISFPVRWELDKSIFKEISFKGFEAGHKPSEISGLPRLYYDRTKPYEKRIPFYNSYKPKETVVKPEAYIVPQAWSKVIELLSNNRVNMTMLKKDTLMEVEVYRIEDYKPSARQYEMHHPNADVKVSSSKQKIQFRKGDWYVPMNQEANRFLIETLEPQAEDSYFAWNFFDAILGQKEGYSDYVFEDIAADYLKNNKDLQNKLEQRRASDTAFAKSGSAQLNYVFQQSPWYEPAHMRYPIYRVVK